MDGVPIETGMPQVNRTILSPEQLHHSDFIHPWGMSNISYLHEPEVGEITRVHIPKGKVVGINDRLFGRAGAGFLCNKGIKPSDQMTLEYNLRFPEGFDFVKGGKLPGLYGGNAPTGGAIPNGVDGFTTRLMWRKDGVGEVYAYIPHEENEDWPGNKWGMSIGRGIWQFFPDGRWHKVKQEIKLNTPREKDGIIRVWYDDNLTLERNGVLFRKVADLKAEGLCFSVFFGGNDLTWASPQDTNIDFAKFTIETPR